MRINLTSVMVNDQAKALAFYTQKLGFKLKRDVPMGEGRWLTVVAPEGHDDVELLLEPMGIPDSNAFQKALYDKGIPLTVFASKDLKKEFEHLSRLGVEFKGPPEAMGPVTVAVFDDTCGNWIGLAQEH